MAILKRKIAQRIKGSLQEREDWWYLCYDTDSREFSVEHEWHHMDAYRVGSRANEGRKQEPLEHYRGAGLEKIEQAKAELLAEAGHA
jgi:hypothetical protein